MTLDLSAYSKRARIALENPQMREGPDVMLSRVPQTRETKPVGGMRFVSVLTVDLDDPPCFHQWCGFVDRDGPEGTPDYFVPLRMWQPWQAECAEMDFRAVLFALPREIEKVYQGLSPKGRPSVAHRWVRLTSLENDYVKALRDGYVAPTVPVKEPGWNALPGEFVADATTDGDSSLTDEERRAVAEIMRAAK